VRRLRRPWQVARSFIRMGFLLEISYPLAFVITQFQAMVPVFTYYFVAEIVGRRGAERFGGDYFTFIVVAAISVRMLTACLGDLSSQVDEAIQQGRLETLLIEPIRWRLLPICLIQWPLFIRFVTVLAVVAITIPMGAHFVWSGLPMALLITTIGIAATLSIGTLAMSVKVLSKRSDPVMNIYSLASQILSGTFFPIEQLPRPLRIISYTLPQTYVIAGNRAVLMSAGDKISGPSPQTAVIALSIFSVIGLTISMWLFGRTLDYARKLGVLGGY
jgi:ABC-2 type transport system permease protein